MKAKRIIAWLLICVLQLGVCLVIPLHGIRAEQNIAQNGESYSFALRGISVKFRKTYTSVEIMFPAPLPMPESEMRSETIVRKIEVGTDGLARVRERGATWQEAETYLTPPVWDLYDQAATWLVSDGIQSDLDGLRQIMEDLRSYLSASPDGTLSNDWRSNLMEQAQALKEPALRDLAYRQIEAKNGEELFDSYISGILYEDTVYWQEVWIAGIHVASIHN